ncbi:hypothetical protein ES332_A02G117300v1 [Gossypium tomentosum]|uniref:BZIP domain-containing protein n=1 Tax=Gossypium tomentosum TaxID=34277 RepID=A0A5D2RJ12_GOSTO|nr:hypothetical protein ES332_A02G117300v1 [Gossypium tomentosum]
MEGIDGAEGEEIEAQSQKQKTQAEKQRHNASCRWSRLKKKMMHLERDQEFLKLQANHKRTKMELEYQAKKGIEYHGKLQSLKDDNQILRTDLHTMKVELERTRQISVALMAFYAIDSLRRKIMLDVVKFQELLELVYRMLLDWWDQYRFQQSPFNLPWLILIRK